MPVSRSPRPFTLPTRLPAGVTLGSVGYARIAVIVDPENVVNESIYGNNDVTLRSRSSSGCRAMRPPCRPRRRPGRSPRCRPWRSQAQNEAKVAAAAKRAATVAARARHEARQETPPESRPRAALNIAKASVSVARKSPSSPPRSTTRSSDPSDPGHRGDRRRSRPRPQGGFARHEVIVAQITQVPSGIDSLKSSRHAQPA